MANQILEENKKVPLLGNIINNLISVKVSKSKYIYQNRNKKTLNEQPPYG